MSGLGKQEERVGRGGVCFGVAFLRIECGCISNSSASGRAEADWPGIALGFRFAVAGGPRIFTPADMMTTSSTDVGTSTMVVLMSSCSLASDRGEDDTFIGVGPSGVTGDDSNGVSAGEWE